MLITIRNPLEAHALTVVAGEAMSVGNFVTLAQGAAKGDPPKVMKTVEGDIADATKVIGIVDFVHDNDLTIDFLINPATEALTLNTGSDNTYEIALGTQCVMWINKPIVGFHSSAVAASINMSTIREPAAVAIDSAAAKLGLYDSGEATRDVVVGVVLQHEGPELTVLLKAL